MAWRPMAQDSFNAANELIQTERWRSVLSRAYFAAYARSVAALTDAGVRMPARGNPSHAGLPDLIRRHLGKLSPARRESTAHAVAALYRYRLTSDYAPTIECGADDCRIELGYLSRVFRQLKREYP